MGQIVTKLGNDQTVAVINGSTDTAHLTRTRPTILRNHQQTAQCLPGVHVLMRHTQIIPSGRNKWNRDS